MMKTKRNALKVVRCKIGKIASFVDGGGKNARAKIRGTGDTLSFDLLCSFPFALIVIIIIVTIIISRDPNL